MNGTTSSHPKIMYCQCIPVPIGGEQRSNLKDSAPLFDEKITQVKQQITCEVVGARAEVVALGWVEPEVDPGSNLPTP